MATASPPFISSLNFTHTSFKPSFASSSSSFTPKLLRPLLSFSLNSSRKQVEVMNLQSPRKLFESSLKALIFILLLLGCDEFSLKFNNLEAILAKVLIFVDGSLILSDSV